MSELLLTFGLANKGGNYQTVKNRAKEESLSLDGLRKRYKQYQAKNYNQPTPSIPIEQVLVEHSNYSRKTLKNRLIKENLLEYKCVECGITDLWNNKPIKLQIDHINGISDDNRLGNLRFICPNCHSQTSSYAGKNKNRSVKLVKPPKRIRRDRLCTVCGISITKSSTSGKCHKCVCAERRIDRPTKDQLVELLKVNSYVAVGKMYNVSDNAIRKWLK